MNITKNIIAIAAIAAASFSGIASAENPQVWFGPEPVISGPSLARTEVLADLAIWNRAGMNMYPQGDNSSIDAAYEQRMAQYQKMRSGPEYQAELRRLGGVAK
ncbi:hypothetical protein N0K08_08800 [Acidovorax sp. Be4]|uniref:DUF4148 domain-containing protein n=1 Tax=Acidovorax bellezanensis TaxID=2976702 RepID=A0ABT2PJS1_9BURK|nr:DUF4148 domain-containing protein [Acidovorax sp. Be4]MCT9810731.1 hypothetical protein [Acidovorax sp. Be4]